MALFSAMHESGHGLYEAGVDPELGDTPLGNAALPRPARVPEPPLGELGGPGPPLARAACCRSCVERFPDAFDEVDPSGLERAANRVERSLIRIEADEVTYNLHILIRFELELEIFEERPARWPTSPRPGTPATATTSGSRSPTTPTACSRTCTGRAAPSATSRPTASATSSPASSGRPRSRDLGDLPAQIAEGDLASLGGWLRERVHRHGRRLSPPRSSSGPAAASSRSSRCCEHLRERVALAVQA